jgi:hypothetical protein
MYVYINASVCVYICITLETNAYKYRCSRERDAGAGVLRVRGFIERVYRVGEKRGCIEGERVNTEGV